MIELPEKKTHPLDKYVIQLMPNQKPTELSKKEQDTFENYWKIFLWRCKMHSPEQTRQWIIKEFGIKYARACELYNDMEYIFGKTEEVNKVAQRRALVEHLYMAMQVAVSNKNEDAIIKCTKEIATLLGLYDTPPELDPAMMMPKRQVVYQTIDKQQIILNRGRE